MSLGPAPFRLRRAIPALTRFGRCEAGAVSPEFVALSAGIIFLAGVMVDAISEVVENESGQIVVATDGGEIITQQFGAGAFREGGDAIDGGLTGGTGPDCPEDAEPDPFAPGTCQPEAEPAD